jgi:hypothetical protein
MIPLYLLGADLAAVVDHTDPEQSAEFRTLTTSLFAAHVCGLDCLV